MHTFDYHRAESLDAVAKRSSDTVFLAGGQGLLPEMKVRARSAPAILDIKALLPRAITVADDHVKIGAGATHAEIAADTALHEAFPTLFALAANIGDPAVRHRGTLGGALAQNHPASDWNAAALALDAVLETDLRQIALADYLDEARTGSMPRDLILCVTFRRTARAAYVKLLHPAQRFPITGSFAAKLDGRHRIGLTGLSETGAFRWSAAEDALDKNGELPIAVSPKQPQGDHIASAVYRVHAAVALTRLALGRMKKGEDGPVSIVHGKPL